LAHADVRVGRARRILQQRIRPNDRHVGDVDAHRVRNPNDHRVELPHGRNQGHGHVGARASQQNYATRLVILTERYRVILASESFLTHCGVRVREQRRSD